MWDVAYILITAVFHRYGLIQTLGYCFGDQGFFVLFQQFDLLFNIGNNTINLPTSFIKIIGNSLLLRNARKGCLG